MGKFEISLWNEVTIYNQIVITILKFIFLKVNIMICLTDWQRIALYFTIFLQNKPNIWNDPQPI